MISFFEAMVFAIVQGVTEWLPVSSSAHLAIADKFLGIKESSVFLTIILHFATALVVLFMFREDFFKMAAAFFRRDFKSYYGKMALLLIAASIPAALFGVFLVGFFESVYSNIKIVGLFLLFTGLFLFIIERRPGKKQITLKESIAIGLAQVFAILPGISRSGATIGTALLLGINKEDAAKFAFFLGVPLMIGGGFYNLAFSPFLPNIGMITLASALFVTALTSFFSIKLLLRVLVKGKLWYFGVYCFALSLLLIFA